MIIWYLYTSQFDQHAIGYDIFAVYFHGLIIPLA